MTDSANRTSEDKELFVDLAKARQHVRNVRNRLLQTRSAYEQKALIGLCVMDRVLDALVDDLIKGHWPGRAPANPKPDAP